MANFNKVSISGTQTLGVDVDLRLYAAIGSKYIKIFDEVVSTGGDFILARGAGGTGASSFYKQVDALHSPFDYIVVCIDPASDPSTGEVRLDFLRA